jgi:hypothetical protein
MRNSATRESGSELGGLERELGQLRAAGRAVRVGPRLHFHSRALEQVRALLEARLAESDSVTIAELRTSRKFAQALLEHFDGEGLTLLADRSNAQLVAKASETPPLWLSNTPPSSNSRQRAGSERKEAGSANREDFGLAVGPRLAAFGRTPFIGPPVVRVGGRLGLAA